MIQSNQCKDTSRGYIGGRTRGLIALGSVASLLLIAFVVMAVVPDPPHDYTHVGIEELTARIAGHEREIARWGDSAWVLDADRYWPYDLDRAVLGVFRFREDKGQWPKGWDELKASGLAGDVSCIHENWRLEFSQGGWTIQIKDSRKIAVWRKQ